VQKPSAGNYKLVEQTIALWQRRSWRELSPEDARQIAENVTGFFTILAEWSRAEVPIPTNDSGSVAPAPPRLKDEQPPTGDDYGWRGRAHD
jgi:hypothetical protein